MATIQELRALALQIRDADEDRENTALKVGQFLYDLLGYLDTKADLTTKGQWSKQLSFNQTPIVALQSVEAIPDTQGQNNKMWWSSDDGQLKWKANDEVYPLGNPTYILYYCGKKIYRWSGSTAGFTEMFPFSVINDVVTGGEGDALSAEMGKYLGAEVSTIRNALLAMLEALAPMAFIGDKPTSYDLGLDAERYSVTLNLPTGVQSDNAATGIYEGGTYRAVISAESGYRLQSLSVTHNGNAVQVTIANNQASIRINDVEGAIVITATAAEVVTHSITANLSNCSLSNTTSIPEGDSYSGFIAADEGCTLYSVVVMMGGDDITEDSYDAATGIISIDEVTDDIVITAVAYENSNVMYKGVTYLQYSDGPLYLLYGYSVNRYISPLIDIRGYAGVEFKCDDSADSEESMIVFNAAKKAAFRYLFNSTSGAHGGRLEYWGNAGDYVRITFKKDKISKAKIYGKDAQGNYTTLWDGSTYGNVVDADVPSYQEYLDRYEDVQPDASGCLRGVGTMSSTKMLRTNMPEAGKFASSFDSTIYIKAVVGTALDNSISPWFRLNNGSAYGVSFCCNKAVADQKKASSEGQTNPFVQFAKEVNGRMTIQTILSANADPRTFTMSGDNLACTHARLLFPTSGESACYFDDTTNNERLWPED